MLAALALNWAFLLLRASLAALFGIVVLVWPNPTMHGLVLFFGAYAMCDGAVALILALGTRGAPGFGSLLFEAVIRLGVGLFAFLSPGVTALAIAYVFAAWSLLSGVAVIAAAIALRRELSDEWPLPLAGVASILFGVLIIFGPAPPPDLPWVIGPYALLFGLTLLALALRLRQLAEEMVAA